MLWLIIVEWLARLILALLVGLSIWSVKIIIEKKRYFNHLNFPYEKYKKNIKNKNFDFSDQPHDFLSHFFIEVQTIYSSEKIEKIFESFIVDKKREMESGLSILGTLGSTTPFVGLLGTILGIIVSFGELSQGSGNTNSVMFSLAEALILTAVGLIVAIPAVVSYNYFGKKMKIILNEAESLKNNYIAYKDVSHGE